MKKSITEITIKTADGHLHYRHELQECVVDPNTHQREVESKTWLTIKPVLQLLLPFMVPPAAIEWVMNNHPLLTLLALIVENIPR